MIRVLCLLCGLLVLGPFCFAETSTCDAYKMAKAPARASVTQENRSFLWRVTAPGGGENYFVGTFHTAQVATQWEGFSLVIPQLKTFVSETDFSRESALAFSTLSRDPDENLRGVLGEDFLAKANSLAAGSGQDLRALKPWAAFLALVRPANAGTSVDAYLEAEAKSDGLKTVGLQTGAEMVSSIETLTQDEQVQILRETICNHAAVAAQVERLQAFYAADDVAGFLAESESLTSPVAGLTEKMNDALVARRNGIFTPRLLPLLASGGALVAVGASHLFGEAGLIDRLRAEGYKVEALDRAEFMRSHLAQANAEGPRMLSPLLSWLDRNSSLRFGSAAPRLRVISSPEMRSHGCNGNCGIVRSEGQIWISQSLWSGLKADDPQLSAALLGILIREAQEAEAPTEKSCAYWQQKNLENYFLRVKYLSARGIPAVGLQMLPIGNCSGG